MQTAEENKVRAADNHGWISVHKRVRQTELSEYRTPHSKRNTTESHTNTLAHIHAQHTEQRLKEETNKKQDRRATESERAQSNLHLAHTLRHRTAEPHNAATTHIHSAFIVHTYARAHKHTHKHTKYQWKKCWHSICIMYELASFNSVEIRPSTKAHSRYSNVCVFWRSET